MLKMAAETQAIPAFYDSPRGDVAARLIAARLEALWPHAEGLSVLGIGHPPPYLRLWRPTARRCVALTPARHVDVHPVIRRWPADSPSLSCLANDETLPFPDLSFDRILLVHALETAEHAQRMLREVWRVLRDDGRLVVVAPNRRGMWAHVENTPFGQGQPYSVGQIDHLLRASLFRAERHETALFLPPTNLAPVLRAAGLIERTGRTLAPGFAGVTITEAVKDVYAALPVTAPARRVVVVETA